MCTTRFRFGVRIIRSRIEQCTYRGHQLIGRPHPGHPISVKHSLDELLHRLVPLHEAHVSQVESEEYEGLVPVNIIIAEEIDQGEQTGAIKGAIAKQRPPCEGEHGTGEYSAHADHEENIEYGGTDDSADTDIVERHEHADYRCEKFGGRATGRHEGSTRNVVGDLEFLDDHVQRRHEELVANDRQSDKHVHNTDYVKDHGTASPLMDGEEILGKERRLFLGHVTADLLVMVMMNGTVVSVLRA